MMPLELNDKCEIKSAKVLAFRTYDILGLSCVFKLTYEGNDSAGKKSVQLALTREQCELLGRYLIEQALIIAQERADLAKLKGHARCVIGCMNGRPIGPFFISFDGCAFDGLDDHATYWARGNYWYSDPACSALFSASKDN